VRAHADHAAGIPGAVFMYLSSAAPNKRSLGATNGLAHWQSVVSIQRTVAPAVADWLFAFSIANRELGVYRASRLGLWGAVRRDAPSTADVGA